VGPPRAAGEPGFLCSSSCGSTSCASREDAPPIRAVLVLLPIVIGGLLRGWRSRRRAVRAAWNARETYLAAEDRRFLFCWFSSSCSSSPSPTRSSLPTRRRCSPAGRPLRARPRPVGRPEDGISAAGPSRPGGILAAGIVLFPSFTQYRSSVGGPVVRAPRGADPGVGRDALFVRRLSAERVVYLSFLLLALFLTSINRRAEYLGRYKSVKISPRSSTLPARGRRCGPVPDVSPGASLLHEAALRPRNEVGELESAGRAADREAFFLDDAAFLALWNSPAASSAWAAATSFPCFARSSRHRCSTDPMRVSSS